MFYYKDKSVIQVYITFISHSPKVNTSITIHFIQSPFIDLVHAEGVIL